ncbi:MAG TPA: tetratricopeptide repeat protein [Verrucomicrobiae bacterium]|nr:tetratricopeptide repeat protein [Verrucomicrobiae bacterium]
MIVIVLQALGVRAVWPQEPAPPPIEKQVEKQEKIYSRPDADAPRSYITNRGLSLYAELLPAGFCDALGALGRSDGWLDIGAGQAQAILDYYTVAGGAPSGKNCARPGPKARAVAISIEDRRTDQWRQQAASVGGDRMRYLAGKRLRQYSDEELGKFRLITDVFGGFTYTEDLSQFVEKVLGLLEIGGSFYTLVPGVRLEDGNDEPGSHYLTELEDAAGRPETVCSWLKRIAGVEVTCESRSGWTRPTELINIRKIRSDTSVPRMRLLNFEPGYPPRRHFQLDGAGAARERGNDVQEIERSRRLAEQGHQWAQRRLGQMYAEGKGVPQDFAEAIKWYRLAAAQENAPAMYSLGLAYEKGQGVPQDFDEAVKWYRLAAAREDEWAQMRLGQLYEEGNGVPQDYAQAVRWYRLGAAQGYAPAELSLGQAYEKGQGVPQDFTEAVKWYRLAAAQGDPSAQMHLAAMYADGIGVGQDLVRAQMWFTLAGDTAAKNRDRMAAKMTAGQIAAAHEMARRCQESKLKNCD